MLGSTDENDPVKLMSRLMHLSGRSRVTQTTLDW
jgi:hypothetical protein